MWVRVHACVCVCVLDVFCHGVREHVCALVSWMVCIQCVQCNVRCYELYGVVDAGLTRRAYADAHGFQAANTS